MELFSIIELVTILLGVAYLVYYYAQKKVGLHIKALAYFSWLLAFGFVFLVPLDVYFVKNYRYYSYKYLIQYCICKIFFFKKIDCIIN